MTGIEQWLDRQGLGEYCQVFAEHRIDVDVLADLDDADLKLMGIPLGDRKRLLKAARATASPESAAPETVPAAQPRAAGEGAERRRLTLLFCDLVGSTPLARRLDPEDLNRLTRAWQDLCAGVLTRYGGYVARYMGDGVLAYFGYPQAHEDDAERAARSALEIVAGTTRMVVPAQARIERLTSRAGIETGLVVVGDVARGAGAEEHTVAGDAPNLAARLQGAAAPGQVVIGPNTRRLLGDRFEYAALGERPMKGFETPVASWQVLGESRAETRFEAAHGAELTPFTGRDEELAILAERWRRARAGEGQVVVVSGEAGIGKSRLVEQFRRELSASDCDERRYQCSPFHESSALYPFTAQLQRAVDDADDTTTDARARLANVLGAAGEDWRERLALFATLLSLDADGHPDALDLSPERQRAETVAALVEYLCALARRRPVLALFEDAHWVDPTSMDVLNRLVGAAADVPLLLVLTCRPECELPWTDLPHVTVIAMKRLDRAHCERVMRRLCEDRVLPEAVAERIVAKADGVPLFIEELTRSVLEAGSPAASTEAGVLPDLPVPDTLQESLMARLDRRSGVKDTAQLGSVIGREFEYALLAAVSPLGAAQLDDALVRLVDSGLVFRHGEPPLARYVFKHALVQDAAFESLLLSTRRDMHARIADAIETLYPQRAAHEPEILAHHYGSAGKVGEAARYWRLAAEHAASRGSHHEAVAHYRRGLAAAAAIASPEARLDGLLALHVGMVDSLRMMDCYDEALASLDEAETLAVDGGRVEQRARVCYQRGNIRFPLGDANGCLAEHRRAIEFAREAGSVEVEAKATGGIGDALYRDGRMRSAFESFSHCVSLCRQHRLEPTVAAYESMRGFSRVYGFEFAQALAHADAAIATACSLRVPRPELIARILAGWVCVLLGRLDDAAESLDAALAIGRRLGSGRFEARVLADRAVMLLMRGERAQALRDARKAVRVFRAGSTRFIGPYVYGTLARASEDTAEREVALREGESLLASGCVGHNHYMFYRDAIETSLDTGQWGEAERYAQALEHYASREPWTWSCFYAAYGRALAAAGRGEHGDELHVTLTGLRDQSLGVGLVREGARLEGVLSGV